MGKITIEFDSIEESHDALTAINAMKWKMAMWDLDQELRNTTKHGVSVITPTDTASAVEIAVCDHYRDLIHTILKGYNLNLDE